MKLTVENLIQINGIVARTENFLALFIVEEKNGTLYAQPLVRRGKQDVLGIEEKLEWKS